MKEDKKKTNVKKKTNPNRPVHQKVKEAEVHETSAEFADVEDDGDGEESDDK